MYQDLLFGTFDYMRAELEIVHSGEQFWVNSFDNSKIDCMVIPSALNNEYEYQSENSGMNHTDSRRSSRLLNNLKLSSEKI